MHKYSELLRKHTNSNALSTGRKTERGKSQNTLRTKKHAEKDRNSEETKKTNEIIQNKET